MTPAERRRAAGLAAAVVGLHALGFGLLLLVARRHLGLGTAGGFSIGLGLTAYALGMRHAFDVDHIAAIDNTTRKLMSDGQRPLAVGFFFALGHSTVVVVLALLLASGARGLSRSVQDEGSTLHAATGIIGPSVSGAFLLLIGVLNLLILVNGIKLFRRMRVEPLDAQQLERQLSERGLLNRIYGGATRAVTKSWHMYPLGVLFGLGFDTATEVAPLFLAAGAAGAGLPLHAILCLPILFAAGMSLLDTIDGAFMNFAYGWAFSRPVRRVYYNVAITGLSVGVALVVGTAQLLSVAADRLQLEGGVWTLAAARDLSLIGYVIAGLFVLTWTVAAAVWRYGRIEERWSAGAAPSVRRAPTT